MLTLTYSSTQLLNCGPCRTQVIVCVRPELMLSGAPFIDGALLGTTHSRSPSGENVYTYRIDYDETLLAPPTVRLNACDVRGLVCRGCLTDYVDFVAESDIVISPDAGNLLSVLPNGLFAGGFVAAPICPSGYFIGSAI